MNLFTALLAALFIATAAHDAHRVREEDAVDTSGCKWYCENWCDLDSTGFCHQLECNPGDEKDCPGTSCEIEAACRESISEKINDIDQILLIFGLAAACLLALCLGALCYVCCDAWIREEEHDGQAVSTGTSKKALEREGQRRQAALRIQEASRSHSQKKSGGRSGQQPKSRQTSVAVSPEGARAPATPPPRKLAADDMV